MVLGQVSAKPVERQRIQLLHVQHPLQYFEFMPVTCGLLPGAARRISELDRLVGFANSQLNDK